MDATIEFLLKIDIKNIPRALLRGCFVEYFLCYEQGRITLLINKTINAVTLQYAHYIINCSEQLTL